MDTWECVATLGGHNHWVRAITSTSRYIFTGAYNSIKVWDARNFQLVRTVVAHHGSIYSMVPHNQWLVCGTYENAVVIWNIANVDTMEMVHTLKGHTGAVYSIALLGQHCFSASYDTSIRVWNLETQKCTQTLLRHTTTVDALVSHGSSVFSGSADHTIKVWQK
jgi:WD40 repeat protein